MINLKLSVNIRKGCSLKIIAEKLMLLITLVLLTVIISAEPAFSVMLLTPEEAAQEDAREDSGLPDAGPAALPAVGRSHRMERRLIVPESNIPGPELQVIAPKIEKTYSSPLKIQVKFVPRDGTQVDLSSLKVECLKFLSINITDRIKEYVNNLGINVENADLPSGTHKIRITLGDTGGGITSRIFVVKVQ